MMDMVMLLVVVGGGWYLYSTGKLDEIIQSLSPGASAKQDSGGDKPAEDGADKGGDKTPDAGADKTPDAGGTDKAAKGGAKGAGGKAAGGKKKRRGKKKAKYAYIDDELGFGSGYVSYLVSGNEINSELWPNHKKYSDEISVTIA